MSFIPCSYPTSADHDERVSACEALGLTVEAAFVPWSKSRNAGEKNPSLNWTVRVMRNGRAIVETAYSAGMAHAPAYQAKPPAPSWRSVDGYARLLRECETGRRAINALYNGIHVILPNPLDVLSSLAMDSYVLDSGGFEGWADSLGYDTDSRRAEGIYRACLEIGLKLRTGLGDAGLSKLREAFEGY